MLEQGINMDVVLTGRDELRCGKERKERKGHCGYLGVNDNQNITLQNCSEFLFFVLFFFTPPLGSRIQTKANNARPEIEPDLLYGRSAAAPQCACAGFSASARSATI